MLILCFAGGLQPGCALGGERAVESFQRVAPPFAGGQVTGYGRVLVARHRVSRRFAGSLEMALVT